MAKVFYTERDIDDLHKRGVTSLDVHDDIVLTDLARERALKHGLHLNRVKVDAPAKDISNAELVQRVKAAVLARLNGPVDAAVLDAVVTRVIAALK
jgi:hypothetical protein